MQDIRVSVDQVKPVAGFEKLWVWQRAHILMQEIHKFCKTLPREEKFRLRDQIERASSSVCDNIADFLRNISERSKRLERNEASITIEIE